MGERLLFGSSPVPWGHRWESRTIPRPRLRFLVPAPSGACLAPKRLLSPKRFLRGIFRGFGGLGQRDHFPLIRSDQWESPQILGGEDVQWSSHTGAAERRRVTDWKPPRNLPGGRIHPEIKGKGSLAVDPHGFHSKSSAFAVFRQNSCRWQNCIQSPQS